MLQTLVISMDSVFLLIDIFILKIILLLMPKEGLIVKKIINQSEYFNNQSEKFEVFNNITSYDIDNNLYFNAPIGNYSDNIKINFYKIYIHCL